jgi:hypothetical protein
VTKYLKKQVRKEISILAHDFSPWAFGFVASGLVYVRQNVIGRSVWWSHVTHLMADRRKKE